MQDTPDEYSIIILDNCFIGHLTSDYIVCLLYNALDASYLYKNWIRRLFNAQCNQ